MEKISTVRFHSHLSPGDYDDLDNFAFPARAGLGISVPHGQRAKYLTDSAGPARTPLGYFNGREADLFGNFSASKPRHSGPLRS